MLAHRRQALAGYFQQARVAVEEKVGVGLVLETPYSPAELVELRKTKAVRALDEDGVAVRNIEAALDDRRAAEHVEFSRHEVRHHALQVVRSHLAVSHADAQIGQQLAQTRRNQLDCLHAVVEVKHLSATPNLLVN